MPLSGIYQLDFALAMGGFAVGEHPDIGGNASVIKHVEGQSDYGFQPVVFYDPAADVAFALACVASEEWAAIVDFGDATA